MYVLNEIHISRVEIEQKLKEIAFSINEDYVDKEICFIGVLKGAVVFMTDLIRLIKVPVEIDFMAVSSYGDSTKTSGVVKILKDLDRSIANKNVIIVEDIVDTGLTLQFLKRSLEQHNPASVKIVTLLDKPERRKVDITVDYRGFVIPDYFVVGYGLDFDEKYRNLPDIRILRSERQKG